MDKDINERTEIYDKWHKEAYQLDIDIFKNRAKKLHNTAIKLLNITSSSAGSLLDLACGKGIFLSEIRDFNKHLKLYGTDISKYAIDQAKKTNEAEFVVADGEKLPYKDNYFDFCTCLGGLEYYRNPLKGASEAARILKNDGTALFFVPNLMFLGYIWLSLRNGFMPTHGGKVKNIVYYDYSDEKFYTYQGWKEIFQKAGFTTISVKSFNYLGDTQFAHPLMLKLYNLFFSRFIPFYLSYCFIFICKK